MEKCVIYLSILLTILHSSCISGSSKYVSPKVLGELESSLSKNGLNENDTKYVINKVKKLNFTDTQIFNFDTNSYSGSKLLTNYSHKLQQKIISSMRTVNEKRINEASGNMPKTLRYGNSFTLKDYENKEEIKKYLGKFESIKKIDNEVIYLFSNYSVVTVDQRKKNKFLKDKIIVIRSKPNIKNAFLLISPNTQFQEYAFRLKNLISEIQNVEEEKKTLKKFVKILEEFIFLLLTCLFSHIYN